MASFKVHHPIYIRTMSDVLLDFMKLAASMTSLQALLIEEHQFVFLVRWELMVRDRIINGQMKTEDLPVLA